MLCFIAESHKVLLNQLGWGGRIKEWGRGEGEGEKLCDLAVQTRSWGCTERGFHPQSPVPGAVWILHGFCLQREWHLVETEMGPPYTKLKHQGWGVKCPRNSAKKML